MLTGSKWHRRGPWRTPRLCRHAKTSELASAVPFFWQRVYGPISFSWMNGEPVGSRARQVFPLWAVWEYWKRLPVGASSPICAKRT
jgi:hypothetical protein